MRLIEHITKEYPDLDLTAIMILLTIYDHPGFCIREIADILMLDKKSVQLKIALMAEGRGKKRPRSSKRRLVNVDRRFTDRRKRDLMLTDRGSALAELLQPLRAEVQP